MNVSLLLKELIYDFYFNPFPTGSIKTFPNEIYSYANFTYKYNATFDLITLELCDNSSGHFLIFFNPVT